jgi:hypothetical protein
VIVDHLGVAYVCETKNNRIMHCCKGAREGNIVVDGNGEEQQAKQFNRLCWFIVRSKRKFICC